MYLTGSMHLNLCQDLKINLPQALLTMLVICLLIHCNFSFLSLCHVYSLLLACPKHCYKSLSYSTPWFIKQNHSRSQLIYLYNLRWFLLSLLVPITFCSRKKAMLFAANFFYIDVASLLESAALLWGRREILWQLQLNLKWKFQTNSIWRWNSDWNSSSSVFIFILTWIGFALASYLQFNCVNYTQFVFSCCPTLLIADKKQFSNVHFIAQMQAEANPKLHPYGADLSIYLTLLLIFSGSNMHGFYHYCALLVIYSSVFISLLPFPCFFSKCGHARNPSFLVERASNHSSFNTFWLLFCVFSHVGSSCLLHSGISWQQLYYPILVKHHVNI